MHYSASNELHDHFSQLSHRQGLSPRKRQALQANPIRPINDANQSTKLPLASARSRRRNRQPLTHLVSLTLLLLALVEAEMEPAGRKNPPVPKMRAFGRWHRELSLYFPFLPPGHCCSFAPSIL